MEQYIKTLGHNLTILGISDTRIYDGVHAFRFALTE